MEQDVVKELILENKFNFRINNVLKKVPDGSVSWNEQCASQYNCETNMECVATSSRR